MINFPLDFGKKIRIALDKYYLEQGIEEPEEVKNMYDKGANFLESELENIKVLNVKGNEVRFLKYFKNLKTVIIDSFPSISDEDFTSLIETCPHISSLAIKHQAGLKSIDVSRLSNLTNLSIVSNEHLKSVVGIEDLYNLNSFEFYDNVSYEHVNSVIEHIINPDNDLDKINLDVLYYVDLMKEILKNESSFDDIYEYVKERFIWSEKLGFRNQSNISYTTGEMQNTYETAIDIYHSVSTDNETDVQKFADLYVYVFNNIKLGDAKELDGTFYGLKNRESNARSFAKLLQFLLRVAGIESFDINTLEVSGKEGILAGDDYFILRTHFDDKVLYSDPATDVYSNMTSLDGIKYFLLNKNSICETHRICGEMSILNTESFTEDEVLDLLNNARQNNKNSNKTILNNYNIKLAGSRAGTIAGNSINEMLLREVEEELNDEYLTIRERKNLIKKKERIQRDINFNNAILTNVDYLNDQLSDMILSSSIQSLSSNLGFTVSKYKYVDGEQLTKTVFELETERKEIKKKINMQRTTGILNKKLANRLVSDADIVFNYFMRTAPNVFMKYDGNIGDLIDISLKNVM